MNKITKLTVEQEAELPAFRQKYLDIACGGGRIDRTSLQSALNEAYAVIGEGPPMLIILQSPLQAMMAIKVFKNTKRMEGKGQLWEQLREQLDGQLREQLDGQLWEQLGGQLWEQLRVQLDGQLRDQLREQLREQLDDQLREQLDGQLWEQLGGQLWEQLGGQLWEQLWGQLGGQLREQLDGQLREQLDGQLREQLRDQNSWNPNFLWGSQDLYWIAWALFAEKIGVKLKSETAKNLRIMERISSQCEWWWPFKGICFASERPTSVKWDDERRLHSEVGPAAEYADGYSLSSWHGQSIPNEWVNGSPPSAKDALHWENMDQRSAAAEIVGWHNVLDQLNAREIEDSGDPVWGRLVEVDLPDSGKERFLDALCGTGRRFALPVPPDTDSVDMAQSVLHGGLPVEILKNYEVRT